MNYEPNLYIEAAVYPYLARWGKAHGYEITTSQDKALLCDVRNRDPVRGKEMEAEGKRQSLNRAEAEALVELLPRGRAEAYDPEYEPPIRLDEVMFGDYFMPYINESCDWQVQAVPAGIYFDVLRVGGVDGLICRSEITELVRDLEYDRRHPPFIVKYQAGNTVKMWQKDIDSFGAAVEVLEREKPRHFTGADWRIYQDVTAVLRHTDDLPEDVVTPDDWLWMRIWFPGKYGGDCWSHGFYDNLKEQRLDMLREEELDIHAVTAIYACLRHDPPPEEEGAAPPSNWHLLTTASQRANTEEELVGTIAVMWAEGGDKLWILFSPDSDDVDRADIATLARSVRTGAPVPDFDHAYLFPFYKGLKCVNGLDYETYFDDGAGKWDRVQEEESEEADSE